VAGASPPTSPRRHARRGRARASDTCDQGRAENCSQEAGREPARLLDS
jgi:hypothetical protein